MDDFLEPQKRRSKHVFRLYRRVFTLVFAVAVLLQVVSFTQVQLKDYFTRLDSEFKVILTVDPEVKTEELTQMGESLSAKEDIVEVKLFSPADALAALQKKNPQLTEALLLMGRNKMPAYFELKLNYKAVNNIGPFVDNLAAEYPGLSPKYSPQHARTVFLVGLCLRIVNMAMAFALLLLVFFMFLVEAYPSVSRHLGAGVFSGMLAAGASLIFIAALVYPSGYLLPALNAFTSVGRQVALFVLCGLLGWTLTKWQKF